MGNVNFQPQQDPGAGALRHWDARFRVAGSHSQRMNAVFADGHVQGINYSVNLGVFQNLCNITDGQVIDSSSY